MGFVRKNFGVDITGNQAVRRAEGAQLRGMEEARQATTGAYDQVLPMLQAQAAPFAGASQQYMDFLNPQAQADFARNNPLLRFMADEAQNRVFSSQAARGKLGSTATATALQDALVAQGMEAVRQRQASLFGAASLGMTPQANLASAITGQGANLANIATGRGQVQSASLMAQQANTGAITGQLMGAAIGGLTGGIGGMMTGQGFMAGAGQSLLGGAK